MRPLGSTLLFAFGALLFGCDGSKGGRDAAVPMAQRLSEISVRVDAPIGAAPSISALAFRASVSGSSMGSVLPVVDPLVTPAPGLGCELRDVAGGARALGAAGGKIELEAFGDVTLDLGLDVPALRPSPRVYPDLASVVEGVVGEAGPLELPVAPSILTLRTGREVVTAGVPTLPRLNGASGEPISATTSVALGSDLTLEVLGPAGTFLELRPFGATWALACALGPGGRVTVPAAQLLSLSDASGRVPVSLEAVSREIQPLTLAGEKVQLSLEVRSSSVVELRP